MLERLTLPATARLLVVAPHCDDETLGAGGLMHLAATLGWPVRVVLLTNGDRFTAAAVGGHRGLRLAPRDYIEFAQHRQRETVRAVVRLGLRPDDVVFLSYPDRGLAPMWRDYWSGASGLYRSPTTRCRRSPYANAYRPGAPHCGVALLRDLMEVIYEFAPDWVVLPHPGDSHPDHWAGFCFAWYALQLLNGVPGWRAPQEVFTYLVHRAGWPRPRGLAPGQPLRPPESLEQVGGTWVELPLPPSAQWAKHQALRQHSSQLRFLGRFLTSFVRRNELFQRPASLAVPAVAPGQLLLDGEPYDWPTQAPVVGDPVGETVSRSVQKGADVGRWTVAADDAFLYLRLEVSGRVSDDVQYLVTLVGVPEAAGGPGWAVGGEAEPEAVHPRSPARAEGIGSVAQWRRVVPVPPVARWVAVAASALPGVRRGPGWARGHGHAVAGARSGSRGGLPWVPRLAWPRWRVGLPVWLHGARSGLLPGEAPAAPASHGALALAEASSPDLPAEASLAATRQRVDLCVQASGRVLLRWRKRWWRLPDALARASGQCLEVALPRRLVGDVSQVLLAVETRRRLLLVDRTPWQSLRLPDRPSGAEGPGFLCAVARREDLPEAAAVLAEVYAEELARWCGKPPRREAVEDLLALLYAADPGSVLVALSGGRVVGCLSAPANLRRLWRVAVWRGYLFRWVWRGLRGRYGFGWRALRVMLADAGRATWAALRGDRAGAPHLLALAVASGQPREVAAALVRHALRRLGRRDASVHARVRPWHGEARRTFQELGFRLLGRARDSGGEWLLLGRTLSTVEPETEAGAWLAHSGKLGDSGPRAEG